MLPLKFNLSSKGTIPQLFDRVLYRKRRQQLSKNSIYFNFAKEISNRLIERLNCLTYEFPNVCQIGADQGELSNYLKKFKNTSLFLQISEAVSLFPEENLKIIGDEENLPLATNSLNLMIQFLTLQAVNDVPGVLVQSLQALKDDGLFLAAFIGEDSFIELKTVLQKVEMEHYKGVSQRVSPWIRTRDAGALLQRAGFALPLADCDRLTFIYPGLQELLKNLQQAKATSFLKSPNHPPLTKSLLQRAAEIYRQEFWDEANQGIKVSLDVIFMTGWKPSFNQQKPLKRGTAVHHLAEILEQ